VDALVARALMATACALLGWLGLVQALAGASAYLVGIAMFRAMHRWRMARVVDEALNELELTLVVRPMRQAGRQ